MPKPVYILCSESGSEDRATGLISHFKVIDQIGLKPSPSSPDSEKTTVIVTSIPLQMVAIWQADPHHDPDQEYDVENLLYMPPDGER